MAGDLTIQDYVDKPAVGSFPQSVKVKVIDTKCADWERYHYAWDLMQFLYAGGVEIEAQAEQFLKKRPKELPDVYQARIERFSYQNHVGQALDYYLAALFEEPPRIEPAMDADPTTAENPPLDATSTLSSEDTDFYAKFEDNCDRAGTAELEAFRKFFKHLVLYGRAAVLIDLPKVVPGKYKTLLEEKQGGQFDPYLVCYDSRQIINYSRNSAGDLDWIMFSSIETYQDSPFMKPKQRDRWYYFDRQYFATYERQVDDRETIPPDDAMAELIDQGTHCLAAMNQVPVIYREVPEGLWLMNRAFSPAKDHLNTDNVLGWSLTMAALAMPVIKMNGEYSLTLSEAGFIKLPYESEYSWSEPEGKSFKHLADRALVLKEEVFRAFYLISQSRSNSATASAQSGISKQHDLTASKKVLNLFGDVMRQVIQAIRDTVSLARADDLKWDVRGLQFPEEPPNEALDMISQVQTLNVPSDSFEKEVNKLVVDVVIPDANRATKQKIYDEIDKAPNKATRELQVMQQQADTMVTTKALKTDGL